MRHLKLSLDLWISRCACRFRRVYSALKKIRKISLVDLAVQVLPPFITRFFEGFYGKYRITKAVPYQTRLQEIIQQHPVAKPIIIFPPGLEWHIKIFQRPHHLALAFARQGALVFYLQRQDVEVENDFQLIEERMYLCNVPTEAFYFLHNPFLYILTWNEQFVVGFKSPQIIYDYVDEINIFDGKYAQLSRAHTKLVREARLVVTTAERLYQKVLPFRSDAILCPNGVDYNYFSSIKHSIVDLPPSDFAPVIATGKPVVGYYGSLAFWLDYNLLIELALIRKDLSFVLIGPDRDNSLPAKLLSIPNVYWFGAKDYTELTHYLRYFDIGIIPFKLNEITHSASPLKLFEYMAGGKPVVITPMQESMRYDGVIVANNPGDFSQKIDQALKLKTDPDYLLRIDNTAQKSTWEVRARQILEALNQ